MSVSAFSALLRPLAMLSACMFLVGPARADDPVSGSFLLDTELYRGLEAAFGDVRVEEDGVGGVHVHVLLDPAVVGDDARIHRLYLSMNEWPEGLRVMPDEPDAMSMSLHRQRHRWHTMGADFGTVLSISPRASRRGHHRHAWHRRPHAAMQEVGFTLSADKPLMLADMLGMTATWHGVVAQFGVDVHGLEMGRRHRAPGLLAGVFEADQPPDVEEEVQPPEEEEAPPTVRGEQPIPADGIIPPHCLGVLDMLTGDVNSMWCP